jgi:hypothetical protein
VATIFTHDRTFKYSLNRAKVFGGAVAMTAASLIGSGRAMGKQLNQVFDTAIDSLLKHDVDFGGHIDEQAHGDNCGCGAIDKAPQAVWAMLRYKKPILQSLQALGIDTTGVDEIYDNIGEYVGFMASDLQKYSGRKVMDRIIGSAKVVKQLRGDHRERRIILNKVRGYTVNQQLVRERTNERVQVFAVDIWRLEDIAQQLHQEQPEAQHQALLSELIYTLSVAAVLTNGKLPIYVIENSRTTAPDTTD